MTQERSTQCKSCNDNDVLKLHHTTIAVITIVCDEGLFSINLELGTHCLDFKVQVYNGIITTPQQSCGKVMFLDVSVRQSVCPQGEPVPLGPLPMMHWTSLYRAPDPNPGPSPRHQIWDPSGSAATSDIWWPSPETCLNMFI